jgi:6-phosphogluconolactonase/glucosamine-6-phosphate isomerase/deaminase
VRHPTEGDWRLSLTPRFLRLARRIFFVASGPEKKEALRRVLEGDLSLPASWLNLAQTVFLVTRDTLE